MHVDTNAFEDLVNAVADLPLQRRGRRPFVFSHKERVLFLHAFLAFGLNVAHVLLLPKINSPSEVNTKRSQSITSFERTSSRPSDPCIFPAFPLTPAREKIIDFGNGLFPKSKNQSKRRQQRVNYPTTESQQKTRRNGNGMRNITKNPGSV